MIGRADIEGSKSNVAMNACLPHASYPCGKFSDTSSFKFRSRIPLVHTSSDLAVRCVGKAPEGTVPSPSPGRHAATRSSHGRSSSSPPIADGFGTGTPMPNPQSQSFSQTYESILTTFLAYIVPSTRGQKRARGTREASIRPAMTARPLIEARCEGAMRCVTPRQTCSRPNGFGCNLRSKTQWFTRFCNSHQLSHFAMFFIDARAEISIVESRFRLQKKHRCPRCTPRTGSEGQDIDSSLDNDPSAGSPMETLLQLLLHVNDKVQWTFHRIIQLVGATGGVYKWQGRSQRELMTHTY
ncbi:hypothetical protein CQW23_32479 [Capsicum baccatum]|uniref:Uncharacterized protein n=1 Tax=Capsicum baccatum TaxID=33114 RepID=A0A2G2V4N4_CAPBA|nr:hypothetical protein CQW23_32479 [Capsicum baccatum]